MRKATIADIAARAGVSTATVDRVLNRRPGVTPVNRQRVLSAAQALGHLLTHDRLLMPSRPAQLEFFFPFGRNSFLRQVASLIEEFAASLPLVSSCVVHSVDGLSPEALLRALESVALKTSGVGIIAVDHPKTRNAIRLLTETGMRVVTIASDVPTSPRSAYVGVDNRSAGRTAGLVMGRMIRQDRGRVCTFLGSHAFHGHEERENGFRAVISSQFPGLDLLAGIEIREDNQRSYAEACRVLETVPDLAGIYCIGAGRSGIARALAERPFGAARPRPVTLFHDLTENTRRYLADDIVDVIIDQNARLVAEQTVIRLLGSIASTAPFLSVRYLEPRIILRENIPL